MNAWDRALLLPNDKPKKLIRLNMAVGRELSDYPDT